MAFNTYTTAGALTKAVGTIDLLTTSATAGLMRSIRTINIANYNVSSTGTVNITVYLNKGGTNFTLFDRLLAPSETLRFSDLIVIGTGAAANIKGAVNTNGVHFAVAYSEYTA